MTEPARPGALVTTEWVAEHAGDPQVTVVEVDVDTSLFESGHIPNAVGWSWKHQLRDPIRRDIISRAAFERLMSESGIGNDSTVVLYGDSHNRFAAWAFWQLKIYGHRDVRIMDGGRKKWSLEARPVTIAVPIIMPTDYRACGPDLSLRSLLPEVRQRVKDASATLVDVRSPQEFSGELLVPDGLAETCQRGGHLPGAVNVPWAGAVNEGDGTFRPDSELRSLYADAGITGDRAVITYCRIGERSSHSWFVLKYLLEMNDVKNYDGSWTEWGNLVGAPIETGPAAGT